MATKTWLVTGGAGFIGGNFIRDMLAKHENLSIVNLDALTYAGNLDTLADYADDPRLTIIEGDIGDAQLVGQLLADHDPNAVVNFAAESHVDRSIEGPAAFVQTNVVGTLNLLERSLAYWKQLDDAEQRAFRFLHVSTDEVYGSLGETGEFTETTPYAPNSPYAASKASSDHLVRAFHHTYGLPVLTTNCSNNYGPYQFPEKLIPLMILKARAGEALPVYGDGKNVRDWLYVGDHCVAIERVLKAGRIGEVYNVGGNAERNNLEVVHTICDTLDELEPRADQPRRRELIRFVTDRPGHDRRYAIDASKLRDELGWEPAHNFADGLRTTIAWYLANTSWCQRVQDGSYRGQRLGLDEAAA